MRPNVPGAVVSLLLLAVAVSCGQSGERPATTSDAQRTHWVVGVPAKVLAPSAVAGWTVVGKKARTGGVDFEIELGSREFTAFAVRLDAPTQLHLAMYGIVGCIARDGGGLATAVRYSGYAPVVLKLDSSNCSHELAPTLIVHARAEKAAKHLLLTAEFLRD